MLVLTSSALAATYVLLEESSPQGLSLVAERTGLPYEELVVLDLEAQLRRGVPGAQACEGPPITQAELAADLKRAVQAYDSRNLDEARTRAATWGPATACLRDSVDPDWLWESGFVTGVFAWADGDKDAARQAWTEARSVDPTRPWDDNFAPGTAVHAFATSYSTEATVLRTVGGPFLVDGRPAPQSVTVGTHVLQSGDPLQTWRVDVSEPVVALHPDVELTTLSLEDMSVVLGSQFPDEALVYAVTGDVVSVLDLDEGTAIVLPTPADDKRRRWSPAVAAGGLVLVAGGLLTALVSVPAAQQAAEDGWDASNAGDEVAWLEAHDAYSAATTRMWVGYSVAGVGAVGVVVATPDLFRQR